jgi:hypothetical protein
VLADSNTIVNRWKSYLCQLLNVHNISYVRQIEIHTAEPLVPSPSRLEVEISIAKLKKYKFPGSDQIPEELYQTGGETLMSVMHKLITSIWNKEEMPDQWNCCRLFFKNTSVDGRLRSYYGEEVDVVLVQKSRVLTRDVTKLNTLHNITARGSAVFLQGCGFETQ